MRNVLPALYPCRSVASWGSAHVGGLFNGACGSTTKARLPSPVALSIVNGTVTAGGLDTAGGAYRRRWALPASAGGGIVESRVWAHRSRKHVLVTDLTLIEGPGSSITLTSLWDPLVQVQSHTRHGSLRFTSLVLPDAEHQRAGQRLRGWFLC